MLGTPLCKETLPAWSEQRMKDSIPSMRQGKRGICIKKSRNINRAEPIFQICSAQFFHDTFTKWYLPITFREQQIPGKCQLEHLLLCDTLLVQAEELRSVSQSHHQEPQQVTACRSLLHSLPQDQFELLHGSFRSFSHASKISFRCCFLSWSGAPAVFPNPSHATPTGKQVLLGLTPEVVRLAKEEIISRIKLYLLGLYTSPIS